MKNLFKKPAILWIGIIVINILLFGIGLLVIIMNDNIIINGPVKVVFDQNFSEKTFVIYEAVSKESILVDADYTDNTTSVMLTPGVYTIVYDNGETTLAEQNIIIPNEDEVLIETKQPILPEITTLPTIASGLLSSPLTECEGYDFSRGFNATHQGVDVTKEGGCWITAAGNGMVIEAGWGSYGEGFYVVIDHGNGLLTKYHHGDGRFVVKEGLTVRAGQRLMFMGASGNSTGVHLHFEISINGQKVNPENYIEFRNS